ncbi:Rossmann-fold NAD(P)-binding domain-containing protein [Novosphingobium taihuense]|uniref:Nucleoside-diphosphate-sugar epimerase n=1 Tax=Novosphingobium taihuense TaxID=260085 RepID=A0A7W7EUE8_9SPHN|nr:SDR family NAD(P)-dependent oxidoreductase [Novosphingobium taihuense]MBB4614343.1 nucleoside-diphosphate-sugar epimerase [Novosphingobium taihuense]TWH86414.1 nucleoside-diphosphate-sugar epimerase [Novosphingobium taihuense]
MGNLLIFGMGYTSQVIARRLRAQGWTVRGTGSAGDIAFADRAAVEAALAQASHVLSSVPPIREGGDPVLQAYGEAIAAASLQAIGYLSSTGVYGDAGGAWVDEGSVVGTGRRSARTQADLDWQALSPKVRVFRLPGIYGPGRSALERVAEGKAHRIDIPGQVFSRVHVEDIASGVIAGFAGPAGIYNLADDLPCSQNAVIEEAARMLGVSPPPMQSLQEANLSPMALAFYAENRRVANGKAKRLLGWKPAYPTYREGLRALSASTRPTIASADPASASTDQR